MSETSKSRLNQSLVIAVDFDGTCVEHQYPHVGPDCFGAVDVLKDLVSAGHRILLLTMRSGTDLLHAEWWFKRNGILLWAVNNNPEQERWTTSPKVFANLYIDDAALGCPLVHPAKGRPYVDWIEVRKFLEDRNIIQKLGPIEPVKSR